MPVEVGDFDFSEVWDGVLYKKPAQYPRISPWEIRNILEFSEYEAAHGRSCPIRCREPALLAQIYPALESPNAYRQVPPPAKITECTACPVRRGCETEYVCHTTSLENALSILSGGCLLSAVNARGVDAQTLAAEPRNAAKDPPDYFHYILFTWGNCQAGDRLVVERTLGRSPGEEDLSRGFHPGIRFYFRYRELIRHPGQIFDGVLPLRIRDRLELEPWLYRLVVPEEYRRQIQPCLTPFLMERTLFVENDCRDIWEWSEKIYCLVAGEENPR